MAAENEESGAVRLVKWVAEQGISGPAGMIGARGLAKEYIDDRSYPNNDARVASLINWETSKNFTTGFVSGLGGMITLPLAIPSALAASWAIQARMVGAVAVIYGHDCDEDRVRTLAVLCIVGDAVADILKEAGVRIATKVTQNLISRIPGKVLVAINKQIGVRLLTKAGEKGAINLVRVIPLVGGAVAGTFDAYTCKAAGRAAQSLFRPVAA